MLCKRILRLRPTLPLLSSRKISNPSYTCPFRGKLRAFPFKLSPEDAISYMAPFAAILCKEKIISSALARVLPSLRLDIVRPTRITPVYFPAWIIDTLLEAKAKFEGEENTVQIQCTDGYLPGSDFKVLSTVSFWSSHLSQAETVSFTDELLHQHGYEVSCLPYTISPFSVLDIGRSLADNDTKISEELSFSSSSLKADLFAAYPVLIPVYLAQYELKTEGTDSKVRYATLFSEAFSGQGIVMAENVFKYMDPAYVEGLKVGMEFVGMSAGEDEPIHYFGPRGSFLDMTVSLPQHITAKFLSWLEKPISDLGAAQNLAEASDVLPTDDDLRIRELTQEERDAVNDYLNASMELLKAKRMAEVISSVKPEQIKFIGAGDKEKAEKGFMDEILNFKDMLVKLEETRDNAKPQWWVEWEKMQGPDSQK